MASNSSIEWTEATWNPLTGCTKISPGCKYCYAERLALRLRAMGQPNYANGFKVERAQAHLCQLHERSVPRSRTVCLHRAGVRDYAKGSLAHVPGANEAVRPPPRAQR